MRFSFIITAWAVVLSHLGFVALVIFGGLVTLAYPGFLWWHLGIVAYAIGIQVINGRCPLTALEQWLRRKGGQTPYEGDFLRFYIWRHLGLQGNETGVTVGFVSALVLINGYPYATIIGF